jgi:ATP-binding protein involved in chromosome partitioning
MKFNTEKVLDTLKLVKHPESGKSIIELGMVEDMEINDNQIKFKLVTKSSKDPFAKSLVKACERTLQFYLDEKLEVIVETKVKHFEAAAFKAPSRPLAGVKNIIGVASGKGGVGKSTVAANLAIALAKTGAKVGLLDADIWGPSVPQMFDLVNAKPVASQENGKTWIEPIEKYGIKLLSIGFFVEADKALIWRGSMATNALTQFINDGNWGKLDYIILDMPPGTGDIHLTLVQNIGITGVVIVSTPQEVALADARKGVSMFQQKDINVPVLGLVENMAYFTPAELPNNKYYIFGKDGAKRLAETMNVPLLAQIPLVQGIMEAGESGKPIALQTDHPMGIAFKNLAAKVIEQTEIRNREFAPTKKVEMNPNASCSTK